MAKRQKKVKRPRRPYVATTIMYDLDKMTKEQRAKLARWLHSRAEWVRKHGDLAGAVFRQRLYPA